MPRLRLTLRSGHYILHMRQMHAAVGKKPTVEQGKIRRPVNPRLRFFKESYPRCQTWTIYAAVHVPQSTRYAEESPQAQKWLQQHSGQMEQRWRKILEIFFECQKVFKGQWTSALTYRSEAKMEKTVSWIYSDHWRWKQTYPSWTTSQARAWSTIWKPRSVLELCTGWRFYRSSKTTHSSSSSHWQPSSEWKSTWSWDSRQTFPGLDSMFLLWLLRDVISLAEN